jgi:hypothetical protein
MFNKIVYIIKFTFIYLYCLFLIQIYISEINSFGIFEKLLKNTPIQSNIIWIYDL